MLINMRERKESEYLRTERNISPSKARRNIKYMMLSITLSIVLVMELVVVVYGVGMKIGRSLGEGNWVIEIRGCTGRSKGMIENEVRKYLEGTGNSMNVHMLGDYLRKNRVAAELMIKKEMPNKVTIEVNLRDPFAYMVSGKGYLVDENGVIINELEPEGDLKNFPVIFIEENENNEQVIKKAVRVVKEIGRYDAKYKYLKEVRYDGFDRSFLISLENVVLKVSEDNSENELWKYFNYKDSLHGIARMKSLVDLRFDGQIVLKQ